MPEELLFREDAIAETRQLAASQSPCASAVELTASWRALGLPAGGVVLVAMPNGAAFLKLLNAIVAANFVPAFIAPTTPAPRIRQMAEDFCATAIVRTRIPDALSRELSLVNRIDLEAFEIGLFEPHGAPLTKPGEVVLVTSGTSSDFSSGCVHSLIALRRNGRRHAEAIGMTRSDRVLVNLPLYYSFAFVAQALAANEVGADLVVSGPPFAPSQYFSDLTEQDISITSITPVIVRQILHGSRQCLPSCVRVLTVGGDRLSFEEADGLRTRFRGVELYLTYGLTEAGPRVSTAAAHLIPPERWTSVGKPLSGTRVRIAPIGENALEGELLVHSDTLLERKIGRNVEDPTVVIDGLRWLRTGDIFRVDEDGYLFFCNRKSEFIILKGEKINLRAIKNLCCGLPGVITCRTKDIEGAGGRSGYALEILFDERTVSESGADVLAADLLKSLKRSERPERLTLRRVDPIALSTYK